MKNIFKISILMLSLFAFIACGDDEDQVVPDFLDGTEYGVLLDVDVSTPTDLLIEDIPGYTLSYDINYKGDKRAVESITASKFFTDKDGNVSDAVVYKTFTNFPESISLTIDELLDGTNLSVADLEIGDSFNLKFSLKYTDGYIVDRFDNSMRTNFNINIIEPPKDEED